MKCSKHYATCVSQTFKGFTINKTCLFMWSTDSRSTMYVHLCFSSFAQLQEAHCWVFNLLSKQVRVHIYTYISNYFCFQYEFSSQIAADHDHDIVVRFVSIFISYCGRTDRHPIPI